MSPLIYKPLYPSAKTKAQLSAFVFVELKSEIKLSSHSQWLYSTVYVLVGNMEERFSHDTAHI